MRKMLVVMDSKKVARRILTKKRRCLSNRRNIRVTISRYRKLGKPVKGQYKLYLRLARPFRQNKVSAIEEMGNTLTEELVKAFQDFKYTSLELLKTVSDRYNGMAEVRFKYKELKAEVLKTCVKELKTDGLWEDTENKAEGHKDPHTWLLKAQASAPNFAAGEAAGGAEQ